MDRGTRTLRTVLRALRLETLRSKILVFAVLAALVPSGLTAWLSYLQNVEALEAKISQELETASAQTAREMGVWLKERLYDLRVFASSYEVSDNLARGAGGSPTRGRLNDYLNSVRERFKDYEELLVLDPQGRIVATSAAELRPLRLPAGWIRDLSAGNALVGEAFWDRALGKGILVVAVPVRRPDGRMFGALAARLNLRGAEKGLRAFAPRTEGRVYLLTTGGTLIASSGPSSAELMGTTLRADVLGRLMRHEGAVLRYGRGAGAMVASLKRVPGVEWAVLAEVPAATAYEQVRRFRNLTLLVMGGLLVGVGALAYRLGLLIVRPLERLAAGAAEVAKGDLQVDLPAASGEVGDLTRIFNHMVDRLRQGREELERLSTSDALTGLYNRRLLTQRLSEELSRSSRHRRPFTLLMADVDGFKDYNDTYGHPAGDEVLKKVAGILVASTRAGDCSARYGGEEFAVLLPDTVGEAALEVAERIRSRVARQEFPGRKITLSVGLAEFPRDGDTAERLIASADAALYAAKREGKNRIVRAGQREAPRPDAAPSRTSG